MREHVESADQNSWNIAGNPRDERCRDCLLGGNNEERGHAEDVSGLKTSADARYLRDGADCCANHDQSCAGNRKMKVHPEQHEPKLKDDDDPDEKGMRDD